MSYFTFKYYFSKASRCSNMFYLIEYLIFYLVFLKDEKKIIYLLQKGAKTFLYILWLRLMHFVVHRRPSFIQITTVRLNVHDSPSNLDRGSFFPFFLNQLQEGIIFNIYFLCM